MIIVVGKYIKVKIGVIMIRLFLVLCFAFSLHGSSGATAWDNDLLLEYSILYYQPLDTDIRVDDFYEAWRPHRFSYKKLEDGRVFDSLQAELKEIEGRRFESFGGDLGELTNRYSQLFRIYKEGCARDKRNSVSTYKDSLAGKTDERQMHVFYKTLIEQPDVDSRIEELRKKVAVMCNKCMRPFKSKYIVNEMDMRFLIILVKIFKSVSFIFAQ
jgi:hypothetical protein